MRAVRRTLRALIVLHRTFGSLPAGARLHVLVRFLTCPFLRVVREVPAGATLLEIGAGHGLFARLAVDAGAHRVVALEPDLRKALPSFRHPAARFVAGFDDCLHGAFDVVAMLDVLYAIPKEAWDPLLARVAERVKPGGVFLLKEMDPRRPLKQWWNLTQESLNSRFLGITMRNAFAYDTPEEMTARLQRHGFSTVTVRRLDRGYPHPHVLYLAQR
jgi:cyclopropane fatty-acyl-phospholipid synthase-like methyltransferase